MCLVSVIMPSFNHGKYISKAIESVLNQTFNDFELIISDDCSMDNSVDEIFKHKDGRIKVNIFDENQGAAINTNFLIKEAKGKYIALINSDDIWVKDKLEKQVKFLENNSSYGACFTWASFIDENDNNIMNNIKIFEQPNRTQANWLKHLYINGNCLCHPSILIKSEVYQSIGDYNITLRQLPDFDLWIRLIKKYNINIIQENLVLHRRFISQGENTSAPTIKNSVRDVNESRYVQKRFINDIDDELFISAFNDFLIKKTISSKEQIMCEKFLLLLNEKYYMPKVSIFNANDFMFEIMNSEICYKVLVEKYDFKLNDFYELSSNIDVLGSVIKDEAVISVEKYIFKNKFKVISWILFNKNSKIYNFIKSIYLKCKSSNV